MGYHAGSSQFLVTRAGGLEAGFQQINWVPTERGGPALLISIGGETSIPGHGLWPSHQAA